MVLAAIGWWRQIIRLSSLNGEDACYAVSVLLPGMITLTAFMCCCGRVGEMESQSVCSDGTSLNVTHANRSVLLLCLNRVVRCQDDTTCTALKGIKTGCFLGKEGLGGEEDDTRYLHGLAEASQR